MTPDEIRAVVRRALEAMTCDCYHVPTMEYGDNYPCPRCELVQVAADLEAETAS